MRKIAKNTQVFAAAEYSAKNQSGSICNQPYGRGIIPSPKQLQLRAKTTGWPVAEDDLAVVGLHDRLGDR